MDEGNDWKDAIQILVIHCNHPALSFLTRCKLNLIEQRPLVAKTTCTDAKKQHSNKLFSHEYADLYHNERFHILPFQSDHHCWHRILFCIIEMCETLQ